MSEENKAVLRRWYEECFNKKNLAIIDELIAPNCVEHNAFPGQAPGIEGVKQTIGMFLAAFPDMRVTVDDMIAEGDKVAVRYSGRGTHRGELMGIAATGKQVTATGMEIVRLSGGKMVEHWEQMDMLGMMQQMGVLPPPGQ